MSRINIPQGIIVMTALPPSEGHAALIRFGAEFMNIKNGILTVILSIRHTEPGYRQEHLTALADHIRFSMPDASVIFTIDRYDGPENPPEGQEEEFWNRWVKTIHSYTGTDNEIYVFSSEQYGYQLAARCGGTHIPFNMARDQTVIRATELRADPITHWQQIIPPLRKKYTQSVCLFGQESVGKTTLSRSAAKYFNSVFVNEWARPYLENLPSPEVTKHRMDTILDGQAALERSSLNQYYTPFRFYDTDLLSTLGYWKLWYKDDDLISRQFCATLQGLWKPKDLYIIPRDNIPFEVDPLRYGGTKRETDTMYWINLCEEFNLRYYVMQESSIAGRMEELIDQSRKQLHRALGFDGYVREK